MKMAVEASGVPRVPDRTENLPRSHLGASRKVLRHAPEMRPVVTNAISADQADVQASTRRRVVDSRVPTVGSAQFVHCGRRRCDDLRPAGGKDVCGGIVVVTSGIAGRPWGTDRKGVPEPLGWLLVPVLLLRTRVTLLTSAIPHARCWDFSLVRLRARKHGCQEEEDGVPTEGRRPLSPILPYSLRDFLWAAEP
jgi:hypothetical protein